jgi:hypothetical protein
MSLSINESKLLATKYLEKYIPRQTTSEWMTKVSNEAKFGWDINGIQKGFADVLWDYLDRYQARLRPIFLIQLIEAFNLDIDQYSTALISLEMLYIAAMMVDGLDNELSVSLLPQNSQYPIPVLLTAAYSARQFAPAIFNIFDTHISSRVQSKLVYQFGSYLFQQGALLSVDYWNHQQKVAHADFAAVLKHIQLITLPLTFGMVTDIVIAALGKDNEKLFSTLSQTSRELGFTYRLKLLVDSSSSKITNQEPSIRWLSLKSGDLNDHLKNEYESAQNTLSQMIGKLPDFLQIPFENFSTEILS